MKKLKLSEMILCKKVFALIAFLSLPFAIHAQQSITGKVVDIDGNPLAVVNVVVKGSKVGVLTNDNGVYSIDIPKQVLNPTLVFSFIGYIDKEEIVGKRTEINVNMLSEINKLDEVVVVGFGTQKKVNLTGAVAQIDSKILENRPVTTLATALQGSISGVNIVPSTGNPNQDLGLNVRGTTSINGGGPLILVDGVETNLKLINPNDVENISVLKDAAASSIYGVRAAFGVVLITTKKGKADEKLTINYSGNFALAKPTTMPEFADNSYDHAVFINQSLRNNNSAILYSEKQMNAIKAYMEDPSLPEYYIENGSYIPVGYRNWKEILTRDLSPRQSHSLSFSGGNGKTNFYASAAYLNQEGMLKINPDVFERINTRLNVENKAYDWMKLGFRVLFNTSKMNEPYNYKDDIWHALLFSSPIRGGQWKGDPAYPQFDSQKGKYFEDQNNEVLLIYGGRNISKNSEIILSPNIQITPLKNWHINVDFSYSKSASYYTSDRKKLDNLINYKFLSVEGVTTNNGYSVFQSQKDYYSFNAFTNYEFNISKHNFNVMVGFNQELTTYSNTTSTRLNLLNPNLPSLSLGTGEQKVSDDGFEWALRGGFARLNYNYDNRYLIEINARYDGTSRFPKDNRFVLLPSFSLGWRLSEEKFMAFIKPLFNNFKIRGSYGRLGNQLLTSSSWTGNTRYYPFIPFLNNGLSDNYLFNLEKDIVINPAGLTPATLTWEKVSTINAGLDITLLSSRLDLSLDIFQRTTSDMLIAQSFPEVLGVGAPVVNKGELKTKGWELTVSWKDKIGDVSYNLGLTLFDSQAKISKWDGIKGTVASYYLDKKIGEIWGYETIGFFQDKEDISNHAKQTSISNNWKPGDIKYRDLDENGSVNTGANTIENPGDRRVIGNSTPRYNYGITASVSYKGFFLSLFFQGVGKRDFWPSQQDFWPAGTQYYNTQKHWITDSWTEQNTNAYFPLTRARSTQNQQVQTKYLQDASYLRLKNLMVGYSLPASLISKIKLTKVQIYFSGENLWEHSNLVGPFDPESAGQSGRFNYPFQRVFSIGLDLTF